MRRLALAIAIAIAIALGVLGARAEAAEPARLLFHVSADRGLAADTAEGLAAPLFSDKVRIVPSAARGAGAIEAAHDQILAWSAPGNIQAQRGTLSFYWRAREPVGSTAFPLFRVGYADHSSWDMTWLRIDWNGSGFDAFVTDTGLARTRVSVKAPAPAPDAWTLITFAWDETAGVRLYVNGRLAARKDAKAVYDAGLYAFGPHSRIISPYQVQSRYSFMRGGDIDEIRIYDRMLAPESMAALANNPAAQLAAEAPAGDARMAAFLHRFGWDGGATPPALTAPSTAIRKVEFSDARDVKQWMWKGNDGIRETTWPGVYNRSRLPGRNDYFQLPDWNTYSFGGRAVTYTVPEAERWNQLEIAGPAYGRLDWNGARLGERARGVERTWTPTDERAGGRVTFTNTAPETPIEEIGAYRVTAGAAPAGSASLSYTIRAGAAADQPALAALNAHIGGRYAPEERATVVALPEGAPTRPRAAASPGGLPLVHILIPSDLRDATPGGPVRRFAYDWRGLDAGLDGVALDLPALKLPAGAGGLIPLNIRVKDPLWPERDLMDVNVSVRPGEARSLWLDTRDRLLPEGRSLYITVASAAPGFGPDSLDGAAVRLVFKPRAQAIAEHVQDRFQQVRDNMAFVVEEHPRDRRLALFDRLDNDLRDLLRADPQHEQGLAYWAEINPQTPLPERALPAADPGAPLWAVRQVQDLARVRRFINWWIDQRQVNGEFGGGLSDDTDLTQQWPPLALMGADPDKVKTSLDAMVDAVFRNGMFTDGLSTIQTDELHSYEEGINGISEATYLANGDPKAIERLFATARAYPRIIERNPAGHTHFTTNYYSGSKVARESVWEWSKPYSYLVLHPAIVLTGWNGDPTMRRLITDLADGWLAHAKPDGSVPAEINWRTDAERDSLFAPGNAAGLQLFWAAYRVSGDAKYLRPIQTATARDPDAAGLLNSDAVDALPSVRQALVKAAGEPDASGFARYEAWRATGDLAPLVAAYEDEIRTDDRRMYMVTEGHWWSDRVELFSDLLQRSRLGGLALRRNQLTPNHRVSWRFAAPASAESVAVLVSDAGPERLKVTAYNLETAPVAAAVTGANLSPGRWRVTADDGSAPRTVDWGRDRTVPVSFAPRRTTVLTFERIEPAPPLQSRPDLGIGRDDVQARRGTATVTVHSLGSVPAPASVLTAEDAEGRVLARADVPAIEAPLDLRPRTRAVTLRWPATARRLRVTPVGDGAEITPLNNVVELP